MVSVSVNDTLRALADGTRRDILRMVWTDERAAGEIAARFGVTRQAVSQHLGVLLGSGLVSVRAVGTRRLYRARRRPLEQLRAEFDSFWGASLVRLSTAAQQLESEASDDGR